MPDLDGMEVCLRIRDFVCCPILFLTARIDDADKIKGFGVGADDYIVKPFSMDELGARVAAHLRRERRQQKAAKVRFDDNLAIDYTERCLYYDGSPVALVKKNLTLSNCCRSTEDRFSAKNASMSWCGITTARATRPSSPSISAVSA